MKTVPFYGNREDDMSCRVAATKSILEYFEDREYAWEEVDGLVGYTPGRPSWTVKVWTYLAADGYDIRMIEAFDYERYQREGEAYLKTFLKPEQLSWQLANTDILEIRPLLPEFLRSVHHEQHSPTLQDIDDMLAEGYLVAISLNSRALNEKPGYTSHVVVAYDKDGEDYVVHDSGLPPRPGRRVSPSLLYTAMGGKGNTVEVTGVKKT